MALELNKDLDDQALPETHKPEAEHARPFDTPEVEKLPTANDKDPPYRPWWAIDWT